MEYAYDDETSEDSRVHFPMPAVYVCPVHQADYVGDNPHANHMLKVEDECRSKNYTLAKLLQDLPANHKKKIVNEATKQEVDTFLVEPKWSFTPDRKLVIEHPALQDKAIADKFMADAEQIKSGFVEL